MGNATVEFCSAPISRSASVVIVSTSKQQGAILPCYRSGAAGDVKTSVNLEEFAGSIRNVVAYWRHTVEAPPKPDWDGRGPVSETCRTE